MKTFCKFMLFCALNLCYFSIAQGFEDCYWEAKLRTDDKFSSASENALVQRICVDLKQLVFEEEGMFVDLEGELFPVQFVGYDTQGYYASALYYVCENGHVQPLYTWPRCRKCGAGPRKGP